MKKFGLLFILFSSIYPGVSSQPNWINKAGGMTHDEALDVTHDASGNYYVTGYFTNSTDFNSINITGYGFSDIFIAKYNSAGAVQWVKKAGGTGPDRGYSIKTDADGYVYVTGYYTGTVTFETTTISAQAGSQDVFIAKYDTNGNLIWVTSVGGSMGDTGYGITVDNNYHVIVTGQYKGTAQFGATTLTSMIDPNVNLPAYDIFVVKLDSSGTVMWVQNGAAKYDDRGMDLEVDDANNIFVVGQFSDTIVFDNTYNNYVMNAGFLLKIDENGNELWMKKMSGVQTLLYGVDVDQQNNVFITGDFKGTLGIQGTPMTYVNAAYDYKILAAKFDNNGNVIWAEADASDNQVTAKSIDLDANGDAYIAGLFKCRFNEYSDLYGTGIFYSVGYRDVFITKYTSNGVRDWVRHFGGPKDDYCSGIAVNLSDKPVIAGSYERIFNIPYDFSFAVNPTYNITGGCNSSYCNDQLYGSFISVNSTGQKDIFIGQPLSLTREPYDYFIRNGITCNRDSISPCIENCADTIQACGYTILDESMFMCNYGINKPNQVYDPGEYAPDFDIQWSTGSNVDTAYIVQSGDYSVILTRQDGCATYFDTINVQIHPIPQAPLITDSDSINILSPQYCTNVTLCYPDSLILTATNFFAPDSLTWTGPSFYTFNDSVIQIDLSGTYYATVTTPFGCTKNNRITVNIIQSPVDSLELSTLIADTVTICYGDPVIVYVKDTVPPIIHNVFPGCNIEWVVDGPGFYSSSTIYGDPYNYYTFYPSQSGWYTASDTIRKICGDTIEYYSDKTFYVLVLPNPNVYINITGPTLVCPGDTVTFYGSSNDSTISWGGANIIQNFNDSIWVVVSNNTPQSVTAAAYITDTITGCSNYANDIHYFNPYPQPLITISPNDGIICPGDSLLLTAQSGIAWQWVGPQGNFLGTTQSIYVNVPGYYHCIVTSSTGCIQTSNFVEAKEYNTPYLDIYPNFICVNGTATITVVAASSTLVQWQPPLSGSSLVQYVSAPGWYTCSMTLCGITTLDSVEVTQSNTPAFIISQDSMICPGDSIMIFANGGMQEYLWYPGGSPDGFLIVTQPGSYAVQTTDAYGCIGTSDTLVITAMVQAQSPSVSDTTVCAGQSITVGTSTSGIIQWYDSPISSTPFFTGNNYTTPVLNTNTIYYLQTFDSLCSSPVVPMEITMYVSSLTPEINGDTVLCSGDTLILSANTTTGVNYAWTGPNGFTSVDSQIFIPLIDSSATGIYTLQYSDQYCTSAITSVNVSITPDPQPYILPDSNLFICPGYSITLSENNNYDSYYWSPGGQNTNSITVTQAGNYYVTATENGCTGISNSVNVSVNNPAMNPQVNDTTICPGNSVTLNVTGSGTITWYDEDSVLVNTGNTYTTPVIDSTTVYFVQNTDANGCQSQLVPVFVFIPPLNTAPLVYSNSPVCEGDDIYLWTIPVPGATFAWTGPGNFSSSLEYPVISPAGTQNSGTYQVVISLSGCQSLPGITDVTVNPLPSVPLISGDTVYCEGDSLYLSVVPDSTYSYYWQNVSGNSSTSNEFIINGVTLFENGVAQVMVIDTNGCYNYADVMIEVKPLPYVTATAPAAVCEGDKILISADSIAGYDYLWSGPDGFQSVSTTDSVLNASTLNSGTYSLITTLNGCQFSNSVDVTVVPYPLVELGEDTAICPGEFVEYTLNPAYNYLWSDGSNGNTYTAADTGWIFVTAATGPGCTTSDSVYVAGLNCSNLMPNVFSPNGDGLNELFMFFDEENIITVRVIIFDRWGIIINEWSRVQGSWNGNDKQGNPAPEGVYYWVADFTDHLENRTILKGFVQLHR